MTQIFDKLRNRALPKVQQGSFENRTLVAASLRTTSIDPFGFGSARQIRIRSFGVFEVYFDRELVPDQAWRSPKNKHFMAYLAVHRDRPLSEKRILEEFWEGKSKSNFYSACSRLRSCLKAAHPTAEFLIRKSGSISLSREQSIWHDLDELKALDLTLKTSKLSLEEARQSFRILSDLCRGPFLADCQMDWVDPLRLRISKTTVDILTRLLRIAEDAGDFALAEEIAGKSLQVDPCILEATMTLMSLYSRQGRPEQAARQFRLYTNVLKREFALEPPVEVLRAYYEIMERSEPATLVGRHQRAPLL